MRTKIIVFFILIQAGCYSYILAQSVGVGSNAFIPDPSAGLEIQFSNKGVLIPQVALSSVSDAATIVSPATSLLVFNTGTGGLTPAGYYYNAGSAAAPNWCGF